MITKLPWAILSTLHASSRMVTPHLPHPWRCSPRCIRLQSHLNSFLEASRVCSCLRTKLLFAVLAEPLHATFCGHLRLPGLHQVEKRRSCLQPILFPNPAKICEKAPAPLLGHGRCFCTSDSCRTGFQQRRLGTPCYHQGLIPDGGIALPGAAAPPN